MRKRWLVLVVPGGLFVVLAVFVLALLLIKLLWGWTVPDLFPKAVEQGLVAETITWWTALKLAVFVTVIAAVSGLRARGRD
jgi:uncharacterized membrane protein YqhA